MDVMFLQELQAIASKSTQNRYVPCYNLAPAL